MSNMKCNYWKCSNAVGLFLVALFTICFAWYFINPAEQELHMAMFRMSYLGFEEMNLLGFVLGAIQTYIWGYLAVALWELVGCCTKTGGCCNK